MKLTLFVKADLEFINQVHFPSQWSVKVKQSNGDEEREVIIDPENEQDISGSRGKCNFAIKWPGSNKESYLNVFEPKGCQKFLSSDKTGEFVPVIGFECRGLEPVEWNMKDGTFKCVSVSGKEFDDVEFTEGDWYDYDDDAGESVG
eukprot:CAMPEP_0203761098 /NCGR_PEP_ID=MMETSP0098-20131031/14263_1 /ASSEMBLY_ACC=CAM_ASM_000208 /TAXON_ID=96639 /ORGANISM=" , Strain NY0313808BC1" /LENGTH=145 /DNA_ID=CAMNT_0050654951 /DNA_START=1907 /DNA_END=2341 /DNA_ORIENTATION=+